MKLPKGITKWFRIPFRRHAAPQLPRRGPVDHVVIMDGTMSSLNPGEETNAGLLYKLLRETVPSATLSLYYESGVQWDQWRNVGDVIQGRGINSSIKRAYGVLSSRYRPGDRIFLFGYSRGAFAVRSLAGVLDAVGLLKPENATVRNIRQAYRHYEAGDFENGANVGVAGAEHQSKKSTTSQRFADLYCHAEVPVEMIGVWDTVKALGLRAPLLWKLTESQHEFHNLRLSKVVRHGYHALAMDETRQAFDPVMWHGVDGWNGKVQQVWFRGAHGDVGGQLGGFSQARALSNIPLVWMLDKAERCHLSLPSNWRHQFEQNLSAPSVGTMRGWGMFFLARRRRVIGRDKSEAIHPSAYGHSPKARIVKAS